MDTKKIKRWVPLIVLALLIVGAYAAGPYHHLSLERLQMQKSLFLDYVNIKPALSAIIFVFSYAAAVTLSLPVAILLTLLGGFLFGPWLGTSYVVMGATTGATVIFLIARSALGAVLREKAGGLYKKVEADMQENAVGYMLFMRLVPLFPFFLVNIVPALFNVKLRTYIWTTFLGIIPGTFVYVNLGTALGDMESLKDLVSGKTLLSFSLLGFMALVPAFHKKFRKKKNDPSPAC